MGSFMSTYFDDTMALQVAQEETEMMCGLWTSGLDAASALLILCCGIVAYRLSASTWLDVPANASDNQTSWLNCVTATTTALSVAGFIVVASGESFSPARADLALPLIVLWTTTASLLIAAVRHERTFHVLQAEQQLPPVERDSTELPASAGESLAMSRESLVLLPAVTPIHPGSNGSGDGDSGINGGSFSGELSVWLTPLKV